MSPCVLRVQKICKIRFFDEFLQKLSRKMLRSPPRRDAQWKDRGAPGDASSDDEEESSRVYFWKQHSHTLGTRNRLFFVQIRSAEIGHGGSMTYYFLTDLNSLHLGKLIVRLFVVQIRTAEIEHRGSMRDYLRFRLNRLC